MTNDELRGFVNPDAIAALRDGQKQLDMDGCEVGVSRQALDELLAGFDALSARVVELEEALANSEREKARMAIRAVGGPIIQQLTEEEDDALADFITYLRGDSDARAAIAKDRTDG